MGRAGLSETTEEHWQLFRVCLIHALQGKHWVDGRAVTFQSRYGEALVLTQVDEAVHYHGYSGVDRSNAPSTTPTTEREPLRLVQACSGLSDAPGQLARSSSRKSWLSEETLDSLHAWRFRAWTPPWNRWKWGWRRRRSHGGSARGGWVSRRRRSTNHNFSGQRGAISVMERFGVSLTLTTTLSNRWNGGSSYTSRWFHGWRNASSKTAWGSGIREQYRGNFALRCVANRSIVGDPQVQMIFFATCRRRDHSAPSTWLRRLRRSVRTFDCPGRYLASRSTLWASVQRRSCPVNSQRELETVPPPCLLT